MTSLKKVLSFLILSCVFCVVPAQAWFVKDNTTAKATEDKNTALISQYESLHSKYETWLDYIERMKKQLSDLQDIDRNSCVAVERLVRDQQGVACKVRLPKGLCMGAQSPVEILGCSR